MPKTALEKTLQLRSAKQAHSRPLIFNLSEPKSRLAIRKLLQTGAIKHVIDDFVEQLKELFEINNPQLVFRPGLAEAWQAHLEKISKKAPLAYLGRWIYFPWSNSLNHVL